MLSEGSPRSLLAMIPVTQFKRLILGILVGLLVAGSAVGVARATICALAGATSGPDEALELPADASSPLRSHRVAAVCKVAQFNALPGSSWHLVALSPREIWLPERAVAFDSVVLPTPRPRPKNRCPPAWTTAS